MEIWTASLYACILEAQVGKPGNIYPGREGYDELVTSGFLLGATIRRICEEIEHKTSRGVGRYIHEAVLDRIRVVPMNTNVGIILLHMPLALAAQKQGVGKVKEGLDEIIQKTTVEDAVEVMKAIRESGAFVGVPEYGPDVRSDEGVEMVRQAEYTLLQLFEMSSPWDSIASEWVHGFPIIFSGAEDLLAGTSILQLYMNVLAEYPDSLIRRRYGMKTAERIREEARELVENFSLDRLWKWDHELFNHGINPGTTADLVSASIFITLMEDDKLLERLIEESRERMGV
jgi:triphosphoribosyl-dephospho-CoA synthase